MTKKRIEVYIYFDKNTKIYKFNKLKKEKDKYKNYDFIKILETEWFDFLNTYPQVIKIINGELVSEKRIESLEKIKILEIKKRENYLKDTDWYIIRSINGKKVPKKIEKNRVKSREDINEIEKITKKEDLKKYE